MQEVPPGLPRNQVSARAQAGFAVAYLVIAIGLFVVAAWMWRMGGGEKAAISVAGAVYMTVRAILVYRRR